MIGGASIVGGQIGNPPQVNPAIPDSIGALLTEEWTINPTSTLPSFLERMMMEEARMSGWQTLRSVFLAIEQRLSRIAVEDESQDLSHTAENFGRFQVLRRWYLTCFRRWPARISKAFLQNIFRPFGPEIRFLILYFIERSSLVYSKAALSESLYGGRRVKLGEPNPSNENENRGRRSLQPIAKRDSMCLAFLMAFGPYLEERSEYFFQQILRLCSLRSKGGLSTSPNGNRHNNLQIILKVVWPLLRMSTKGTFLWYKWQYLIGKSLFFDPYSSWLNLVLRRVTVQDSQQHQQSKPQKAKGDNTDAIAPNMLRVQSIQNNMSELMKSSRLRWASGGMVSSLIAMAFIARIRSIRNELQQERELEQLRRVQVRGQQQRTPNQETAVTPENHNDLIFTKTVDNNMIPPPPRPTRSSRSDGTASSKRIRNLAHTNPAVCPLCNEPRINPTASTSGYVFCLKCLISFLRQNGSSCPVTGKPCPESRLVRLYEPTQRTP